MQAQDIPGMFATLSRGINLHSAAETLSTRIEQNPALPAAILQHLNNQEETQIIEPIHFVTITILHPPLVQHFTTLPPPHQDSLRTELLNAVLTCEPSLKLQAALGLLTRQITELDGVEPWLEPMEQLVKWMVGDSLPSMAAGVEFFIHLLRKTPYNQHTADQPFHKLAKLLLDNLFAVFAHEGLSQPLRQKLMYLVLQLVKTFSPYDGMNDDIVRECWGQSFDSWMSLFIGTLRGSTSSNIGIKKYILKILTVIFRDMQRYLHYARWRKTEQVYTIWQYCYKMLPLYTWNHVWNQPLAQYPLTEVIGNGPQRYPYYDDQPDANLEPMEAVTHTILEFLSVITSVPQLQNTIKISCHHLTNCLFHFMLLTQEEELLWRQNNAHFLSQGYNIDQTTIRNRSLSIINELIQKLGDLAIEAVLVAAEKFLTNQPQATTTETLLTVAGYLVEMSQIQKVSQGVYAKQTDFAALCRTSSLDIREKLGVSGQTWHKMEVALLVLGRFSQDIIVFQSKQSKSFDIEAFMRGITNQIRQNQYSSLLKGQALYCLTRYSQIISIKFKQLLGELVVASAVGFLTSAVPLQLMACRALSMFMKKIDKHKIQLSEEQIKAVSETDVIQNLISIPIMHDTAAVVLEALCQICKNKQMNFLIQKITPHYYLNLLNQSLGQQSLTSPFSNFVESASLLAAVFSSLVSLFSKFTYSTLQACLAALQDDSKRTLKQIDIDCVLTSLRLLHALQLKCSQHSKADKEALTEMIPVAVDIMDVNTDVQIQVALSLYLKTALRVTPEIIEEKRLIQTLGKAARILLRIPTDKSFESASIYAGNLIILLYHKLPPKTRTQILQQVVLKVFRSRMPSVIQSLVLIFACLINQNVTQENKFKGSEESSGRQKELVDFLASFSIQNRMGLKILIDKWLLQQSLFRGEHTKTATFMALSRLFLLSDKRIDNLLVIGFNPSHTNVNSDVNAPLKILATLIRSLHNQMFRGRQSDSDEEPQEFKQEGLNVNLEKFKEERPPEEEGAVGGLADRENQQGSTCYMSAMLQFYDDGEQCDDKTEEDLIFLLDTSTRFKLTDYLSEFFEFLWRERGEQMREHMGGLLARDVRNLKKCVKLT